MSKKTFFDAIKPHILKAGDVWSLEKLKKKAKKTDEIGEQFAETTDWVFDSVDLDKYYITANPYNVVAERKALCELHRSDDDIVFIPKYMRDKPEVLHNTYNGVIVNDIVYDRRHRAITKTVDTGSYQLTKDCYDVLGQGYYEKKNNIVQIGEDGEKWARKKDTVVTKDMGYRWYKRDCYAYHNEDGDVEHYRYRNMAPDAGRRILRFNETQFPEPESINERRIGIELEYRSAIDASVGVLKTPRLRKKWSSVRDGSIVPDDVPREQEKSTEFVSVPLKLSELNEIESFMRFVKRKGARTHRKCGFHVHIGKPDMDFHDLTSVVVLCENLEKDLFRLVPDHRQNNEYCKRLDNSFGGFRKFEEGKIDSEERVAEIFYEGKASAKNRAKQGKWRVRGKRHYWLSVDRFWYCKNEPHKRTVEFRMHHSTHDAKAFKKFVLLCYYIAEYAFDNSPKKCMTSKLNDVVESIKNQRHYNLVSDLLTTNKVISKQTI